MQDPYPVPPFATPVRGSVVLPGSKSITNRALILAALADGESILSNCLFSEDTEIMLSALQQLGFEAAADRAAKTMRVRGLAGRIPADRANLFVGNSGTSARFLAAFCCLGHGDYTLDGVPQMRQRPMADLVQCLIQLGADIESASGFAPLRIRARGLRGGRARIDASASSQFVSALIMAAPYAERGIEIELADASVRRGYIDMTVSMLRQFGIDHDRIASPAHDRYRIDAGPPLKPAPDGYAIEGDASAASYFFALPLAVGGKVEIHGVSKDSLQGDIGFAGRMEEAGAIIRWKANSAICAFEANAAKPKALNGSFYPYSDTFLTAAAIAPLLDGPSAIEEIGHTRHQECDRIAAMADGLQRLGQNVSETETALKVEPAALRPGTIATYHDHRVAMSFGVLGCVDALANGEPWLSIEDPSCCKKTFPSYFDVLEDLRQQSTAAAQLKPFIVVAIDGGAAAGKSSTARALSDAFDLMHVDTGSFYRALTLKLMESKVDPVDGPPLIEALQAMKLETELNGNTASIVIDGWTPDQSIRSEAVNQNVSHYAALPSLRGFLYDYQRSQAEFAKQRAFSGLVMEGRDIGSAIFPDANLRLFLVADPAKRALRRAAEGILDSIARRDQLDSSRQASPLACPQGATYLDTSEMDLPAVVAYVSALVEQALLP